jgi:PD-(D/E)XK nuclease superfamily
MTQPKAWSHSALETFENCPKQYFLTKVADAKKYPFIETKEVLWGREVHKKFENYLLYGTALPADLAMHEEFLASFKAQPGELAGEERIALDTSLRDSPYFGPNVWYRGQVDARKRFEDRSHILDHKTGKVKSDFMQLKGFAMHEFLTQPRINTVRVEFYWTQTRATSGETYTREQLWPDLWGFFAPKLKRFSDAFASGVFPPKQSGLCNGWCPVTDCEFWRPKRER